MNRYHFFIITLVSFSLFGISCVHKSAVYKGEGLSGNNLMDSTVEVSHRKLVWNATLKLEVKDPAQATQVIEKIIVGAQGYIANSSTSKNGYTYVTVRVPANSLVNVLDGLHEIGKTLHSSITSHDVTERYVDLEARLQAKLALRDRLQQLLDEAVSVSEILEIERELSRLQEDIDAMQARFNALKGQVDFATIQITVQQKRILGPLGYIFKGAWWLVEKLFVIRS